MIYKKRDAIQIESNQPLELDEQFGSSYKSGWERYWKIKNG